MKCKITYTLRIKWRLRFLWAALAVMLIFMVFIGETGARDSRFMTDFAASVTGLMYWGGMICVIVRIVVNRRLLRDRGRLREQQLRERDERSQYLHRMSGGWVMDALLLLAYIAAVVASCYDMAAFYAAFGLLLCAVILKAAAYAAYAKGWLKG